MQKYSYFLHINYIFAMQPNVLTGDYCGVHIFIQATLQYCVIKPLMAAITLILQPMGYYSDGDWR